MEKVDDIGLALLKIMEANNMQVDYGALFDWVKNIAHSVVVQYPGQVGPPERGGHRAFPELTGRMPTTSTLGTSARR